MDTVKAAVADPLSKVCELRAIGFTMRAEFVPSWSPRGEAHNSERIAVENLIAKVDAAQASGCRVVLMYVDTWGGELIGTLQLFQRLRQFSEGGGTVVVHVRVAASTGWPLALAGDVILIDPDGFFQLHSAMNEKHEALAWGNEMMLDVAECRTSRPREFHRPLLVFGGTSPAVGSRVVGDNAIGIGWADLVGDVETARLIAAVTVLKGGLPPDFACSPRQVVLLNRRLHGVFSAPARPDLVCAVFDLGTTPDATVGTRLVAPTAVDASKLTSSYLDKDNLWSNPSSEIDPPAGADTTQPEWANRYNAGAGAYSGSWVRQVTAAVSGQWFPCSPGATYYAEAMVKRVSGAGLGGRLNIGFYPTLGNFTGGTVTNGAYSTSGSWALVSVTSAAAPAGTNAVYISYEAGAGDCCQFDALYARRVVGYPVVPSDTVVPTVGTGWTVQGDVRKVGGLICGYLWGQAGAGASWNTILTFPSGCRPPQGHSPLGMIQSAGTGLLYVARFSLSSAGVVAVTQYDNGTSLNGPPPAIGAGDQFGIGFAFPWI